MDYIRHVCNDAARRATALASCFRPAVILLAVVGLSPQPAQAANTVPFAPVATLTPGQAASVDDEAGALYLQVWAARGMTIRSGGSEYQCLANLTAALDLVGQLNASEYNGAAGALSLLPTAGALLGAPTREMWIVYKLVPVAGVLSMFLSLGGSITPSNVGDYDPSEPFSYGGYMPTTRVQRTGGGGGGGGGGGRGGGGGGGGDRPKETREMTREFRGDSSAELSPEMRGSSVCKATSSGKTLNTPTFPNDNPYQLEARRFASEVLERSKNDGGGNIRLRIFAAMAFQFVLVVALLIPMWYAQKGAVVVWWCRVWGWMYFWYFLVSAVSIFDNLVAAPFTHSWTIRVSRRPSGLVLDRNVHKITDRSRYENALEAIKAGPNTNQHVRIDRSRASGYSRTCFYVVISIRGISPLHAAAQVVAKAGSVAVFAFGTALFASAALMSISVALMVLCILLACGVAGRVVAMWIVSQISRADRPILHKLVQSETEAGEYIHALAELDHLQLELRGHILIDGYCVHSRSSLFATATYIGLLAKPFDVISLAKNSWLDGGNRNASQVSGASRTSSRDISLLSGSIELGHV